jgi:AcrR family transcriptional regulator
METSALRRRAETKARLKKALLERVTDSSFHELRIEDIAESAGLSRSAFYFYYPDKRALLMDAAAGVSDALYEQADRWWHGAGEPEELVAGALTRIARLWHDNRELLRTSVEVSTYDEDVRGFWRGHVARFIRATAEHITREQKAGAIDRSLDPDRTAEVLVWGTEQNLYVLCTTPGREPEELVGAMTEIWIRTLYAVAGGRPAPR